MNWFRIGAGAVLAGLFCACCSPFAISQSQPINVPPAPSQTSQTAPVTVLHSQSETVLLDIVVTEKGKAVHALDRSHFHVFEDGKEQNISFMEEHDPAKASPPVKHAQLPPHYYNNLPSRPPGSAVNVLLLDALNTPLGNQVEVRRQMLDYLKTIEPGTTIAVFTLTSRLRMIQGFTSNAAELQAALSSGGTNPKQSTQLDSPSGSAFDSAIGNLELMGSSASVALSAVEGFKSDSEAIQTDQRVFITLQALQHLARYLSAVPGRKNVIWFSGSFPIVLGMGSMSNPSAGDRDYSQKVRDTSHLLASARVAVYPMDAGGLRAPARFQAANTGLGPAPKDPSLDNRYTMEDIANQTGGVPLFNNNGFAQAIAHAVDNGSSYYTIAYVPQSKDFNGQFRKFKVRIDGCDCQLSYRSGYYADPAGKLGTSGLLQGSPMSSATLHGAPPATQVIFQSRVLPASDPEFKNANLPDVPLAPQTPSLKGPTHRYVVDMAVDPRTLLFESDDNGGRTTALEIAVVAFEADGKRINSVGRNLELALNATQYAMVMSKGVPIRMAIDLPEGHDYLLMAVHDRIASRVGSLEIALHVSAKD